MSSKMKLMIAAAVAVILAALAIFVLGSSRGGDDEDETMPVEVSLTAVFEVVTKWEISVAGQNTYTDVPLNDGVLDPNDYGNHNVNYTIPDSAGICFFDMRITEQDGTVSERNNRDLCQWSDQNYYDEYPITFVNNTEHDFAYIFVHSSPDVSDQSVGQFKLNNRSLKPEESTVQAIQGIENLCEAGFGPFSLAMKTMDSFSDPDAQIVVVMENVDLCSMLDGGTVDLTAN